MIYVNNLIRWADGPTERLLWVDDKGIIAYVIDIYSPKGVPKLRKLVDLHLAIEEGRALILNEDPFFCLDNENLSVADQMIKDEAWSFISKLVDSVNEPAIYKAKIRGPLVRSIEDNNDVTMKTVYKYLRRYWQRGKTPNALIPDYNKSGGRGKDKSVGEKKRGRPRKFESTIGAGVNVNQDDRNNFIKILNKYYYVSNGLTIEDTYNMLLKEFYASDFCYDNRGIKKLIINDIENVPTFRQFKYWFEGKIDIEKALRSRKGNTHYELNERPILGSTIDEGLWPTYKYLVDATVGDCYLVSSYKNGAIIGRPVIYVVIDVFSRMIVGLYVGLEGPSWNGMMMALSNAMMEKVSYCKLYGLDITKEEWPCSYLPEVVMCDRGEGEGHNINTACLSLGIRVENAAPYRADWKGIVERYFRTINDKVKRVVPGAVLPDFRLRTGKDYRLDATLDIEAFTRLMIQLVLYHNNYHWMNHYVRDKEVLAENVSPIPKDLWNWGIKNRIGLPRVRDEKIIMLSLMPRGTVTITQDGIKFGKLIYGCDNALKEQWYLKAKVKGAWKMNISYDPRNLNNIYIWEPGSDKFESCHLLSSQRLFFNKDLNDIEYLFEYQEYERKIKEQEIRQAEVDLAMNIESIVDTAKNKLKKPTISKSEQVKNIRKNRTIDKEENRKHESFNLLDRKEDTLNDSEKNLNDIQAKSNELYQFPQHLDLLNKKLKERKNGRD